MKKKFSESILLVEHFFEYIKDADTITLMEQYFIISWMVEKDLYGIIKSARYYSFSTTKILLKNVSESYENRLQCVQKTPVLEEIFFYDFKINYCRK